MKTLNKMSKEELLAELKKEGYNPYCYTKDNGKLVGRSEMIGLLEQPIVAAREEVKESLGKDFNKAVTFWRQLRGLDIMYPRDYFEMRDNWEILSALVDNEAMEMTDDSLKWYAEKMRDLFAPGTDISSYSDSDLASFIDECLVQFSLKVSTEVLTKETTEIVKMSADNVDYSADGAAMIFNSDNAMVLTGKKIAYENREKTMSIVESSEDGVTRMLMEKGYSALTIFMGQVSNNDEEQKRLDAKKYRMFKEGITDIATGKHYMFAFRSASATRQANYMFVEAANHDEVFDMWLEICGMKTWQQWEDTFLDKEGKVNLAKLFARMALHCSNSFSISKVSPSWAMEIAKARIDYVKDCSLKINRPYKELAGAGKLVDKTDEREIVPGDGQMIGSFKFHALMAVAMRVISENEYHEFIRLWESVGMDASKVKPCTQLYKLINKIPGVFQVRHGSKKGIVVRFNLEAIEATKDIDMVCPESARKFEDGEWDESPLEICNYLKKKKDFVALNPQFIASLQFEDDSPNHLRPILDYWFQYAEESLHDVAKAQQFHGIIASGEEEDASASALVTALRTNSDLVNESQVCNWRKDQYRKFFQDMRMGRIMVPGKYTYMVCDPAWIISQTYGIELPHLAEGEYYFNGKSECQCGLFRSPLIHPSEAQKVELVNNESYWYMRDVIVFNCYEGAWDRMGGADFDGDMCAVVPSDTEHGAIICDGIKDYGYDIVIPKYAAQKEKFDRNNLENYFQYLVRTAKRDRTGKIANEAAYLLDSANHLNALVYFAQGFGMDTIMFVHPQAFGTDLGANVQPYKSVNGQFIARGFAEANVSFDGDVYFKKPVLIVGEKTLAEVKQWSEYFLFLAGICKVLEGTEIDCAKTGIGAEGPEGNLYIDEVKTKITPTWQIERKGIQGRPVSTANMVNRYYSVSTMGRINAYVGDWDTEGTKANAVKQELSNGCDKMFLLHSLLTKDEKDMLGMNRNWYCNEEKTQTVARKLVDVLKDRKKAYNSDIFALAKNADSESQMLAISTRKELEVQALYNLADELGVPGTVMAAACYIAAYDKDTKQNESLTYGWILFDELISVFSRGNRKYVLYSLPSNVESCCIVSGMMYVNGKKYRPVNAYDAEKVAIQTIKGRNYGLVHKKVLEVVEQTGVDVSYSSTVYTIGIVGFKYHIANGTPDEWCRLAREAGFVADIAMDVENRPCVFINGKSTGALMRNTNFELMNKRIKFVDSNNTIKKTPGSITGLNCVIIDEAQK